MNDKFVLIVPKSSAASDRCVIRMSAACYNRLTAAKQKTGLAIGKIAEDCVNFALDRLEIIEEDA